MLGEVKPDAYEYIPGQCYPVESWNVLEFDHYQPVSGRFLLAVVNDSWTDAQYAQLKNTFGVTKVLHWAGDPSRAIAVWGLGNVWQALHITHDEMQSIWNSGIRDYWLEEPLHRSDLTTQYARYSEIASGQYPSAIVHAADWSDYGITDCRVLDNPWNCYYHARDDYPRINDFASDQYCNKTASCAFQTPLDHAQKVADVFSGRNHHVWISANEGQDEALDVLNWARYAGMSVAALWMPDAATYLSDNWLYESAWQTGWLRKFMRQCTVYLWKVYLGGDPGNPSSWGDVCKTTKGCYNTIEVFP